VTTRFEGSFTQQEPIPEEAVEAALRVLRHGRLHRYNAAPGETPEAALLEAEFAALVGARHALALSSGGAALAVALRAMGVGPGERVLANAWTLPPVPGAIAAAGAEPVLVEITEDLVIDLDDLAAKARRGRVLLLSHMRGHVCDMGALMRLCDGAGIAVLEDCAHTMGAAWDGVPSGRHGHAACYSTQTYKHVNSGEGGLLVTDDPDLAARATILSGSYRLHARHGAGPPPASFDGLDLPNLSARMDNLRAAILRPQLRALPAQVVRWNERYRTVGAGLKNVSGLRLIERPAKEAFVGSSVQLLLDRPPAAIADLVARCAARGVELKWFGAPEPHGYTSRHDQWGHVPAQSLPRTDAILARLVDMRLPLTFSLDDCALIARIVREEAEA
jgi:dTDP-4-amino-4,6-dideoxygalactose transaminase